MTPPRKRILKGLIFLLIVGVGFSSWGLWYHLMRKEAPASFSDLQEHYKYGGIGLKQGFPYYLWAVMPEVFSDLLPQPGGWEVFGLIDEGRGYPVGFAKQTVGYSGLTPNCALCHTGRYRLNAETNKSIIVPGAPAGSFDFGAFNKFVFTAANDARFNPDVLMTAIQKRFELSWSESKIYRYVLLPFLKNTLIQQSEKAAWMLSRPEPGYGRFDAFNLFKITILGLPDDGTIGSSDYPPLWNQGARKGQYLHWNGSGNNLHEDNLMSAYPLNLGASGFLPENFERVTSYLRNLSPAKFPYPHNALAAKRGKAIYSKHCATCHAFDGERVGQVTPQTEIKTDAEFLSMWSSEFVTSLKAINSPPFSFPNLRQSKGYLNVPLDGCWMRAPYLHNGSVPTLSDLLKPAQSRPVVFYRGSDVYDPVNMGFRSSQSLGENLSLYDTTVRGNSNAGHEYGTDLTESEKRDLIEFMKTL